MGIFARLLLFVATGACVAATFFYLPDVSTFPAPHLARLISLHLPHAVVTIVAAIAGGIAAGRYLKRRDPAEDVKAVVAAQLATLSCLLTTVTGMVFAKVQWGAYWNWDPKQTCIFLLLLTYAAYFVLRASIDDPEKRASVGAVYYLFAATLTPLLGYVVPKYLPSLHPTNAVFSREYHTVIWSMTGCLTGLFFWMWRLGVRAELLSRRAEALELLSESETGLAESRREVNV